MNIRPRVQDESSTFCNDIPGIHTFKNTYKTPIYFAILPFINDDC